MYNMHRRGKYFLLLRFVFCEFFQILEKREILTVREFERVDFFFLKSNLIDIIAAKERGLGSDVWHISSHN